MNKHHFTIKPIEIGYGIFLRTAPDHPLQRFPDKKSATQRLKQYLKNVRRNEK